MSRTFEERVTEELDGLYHGALYLTGGRSRDAEALVVAAVVSATAGRREPRSGPFRRWAERCLVRAFLGHSGPPPRGGRGVGRARGALPSPDTLDGLTWAEVVRGASLIPPWPRAALWLVLLRRWSYGDAAEALGLDRSVLGELLTYRDVLLEEVAGVRRHRDGLRRRG